MEHGPKGGDELNLLKPGANYGWPVITYGQSYSGFPIGEGSAKAGMEQPVRYWVPSISPSGLAVYTGDAFPAWRGKLLPGRALGRGLGAPRTGRGRSGSRRTPAARSGRGGSAMCATARTAALYLLTDQPDGALLRLEPVP